MEIKSTFIRFISKVNKTNSCWLWIGAKTRGNYGHLRYKKENTWTMIRAHIFSYKYYKGDVGKLHVLHKCDNPLCVNPDHLFLGTPLDNVKDCINKGRRVLGRNRNHNLLNWEKVQQMRKYKKENQQVKLQEMSKIFKESKPQISRVLNNKIWIYPEGGL